MEILNNPLFKEEGDKKRGKSSIWRLDLRVKAGISKGIRQWPIKIQ